MNIKITKIMAEKNVNSILFKTELCMEESIYKAYKAKEIPVYLLWLVRLGLDYIFETGKSFSCDLVKIERHPKNSNAKIVKCLLEFGEVTWYFYAKELSSQKPPIFRD